MVAEGGLRASALGFSVVEGRGHGVAVCVGVGEEVRDVDGELGAKKKGEECKAGEGDYV